MTTKSQLKLSKIHKKSEVIAQCLLLLSNLINAEVINNVYLEVAVNIMFS
jgi:hypothetical protein